jgi:hypothetical protein
VNPENAMTVEEAIKFLTNDWQFIHLMQAANQNLIPDLENFRSALSEAVRQKKAEIQQCIQYRLPQKG